MRLSEGIEQYVAHKRAIGYLYNRTPFGGLNLCDQIGDIEISEITQGDILRVLDRSHTSTITWRKKYQFLKQFFDFLSFRDGTLPLVGMPQARRHVRQTFVPHIYSKAEIQSLFDASRRCQVRANCNIDTRTFRILIFFLYGTGVRIGEALALKRRDFDEKTGMLSVRRLSQFRCIPLNRDLRRLMHTYLRSREPDHRPDSYLFVTKTGGSISESTLVKVFKRALKLAGIRRFDGRLPRMLDLRHTFGVHRIAFWILNNTNLDRMLPALAVYMGHVGMEMVNLYRAMTPERFRKQLSRLSPTRIKKHWRNDKGLMVFLGELSSAPRPQLQIGIRRLMSSPH